MAYDYNVNMNEMYAPVQTNIVIRSKSGKNSKKIQSPSPFKPIKKRILLQPMDSGLILINSPISCRGLAHIAVHKSVPKVSGLLWSQQGHGSKVILLLQQTGAIL